jgi:hypothetical protein
VWRKRQHERVFITVSSVSIPVALQEDEEAMIRAHSVPSWTLEHINLLVMMMYFSTA